MSRVAYAGTGRVACAVLVLSFAITMRSSAMSTRVHTPPGGTRAAPPAKKLKPNPCNFTGAVNPCPGTLPSTFFSNRLVADLRTAMGSLDQYDARSRQEYCNPVPAKGCDKTQKGATWINRKAREIHLDFLPANIPIVIGVLQLKGLGKKDRYYRAGDNLPDTEEGRKLVFVAYRLASPPAVPVPDLGIVIAGWRMFRIENEQVLEVGNGGVIVQCTAKHANEDPDAPHSTFQDCLEDTELNVESNKTGFSMTQLLSWHDCVLAKSQCAPAVQNSSASGMVNAQHSRGAQPGKVHLTSAVREDLFRIFKAPDASYDPYWFTCAVGCCTAAMM